MIRKRFLFKPGSREIQLGDRTLVMGVINVTPDSFSDGGAFLDPDKAYARAMEIEQQGADFIDIGAESTKPGSTPVTEEEEIRRLIPVLKKLREKLSIPISVDTYKSAVAQRALDLGVEIINDPTGLTFDPGLGKVVNQFDAGLILNHMRGTPETWAKLSPLPDPTATVLLDLRASVHRARKDHIDGMRIIADPGVGFGKRKDENYRLILGLGRLVHLEVPLLVGPSRKSFLGVTDPADLFAATAAAVTAAIMNGAHIVRVHDVGPMLAVIQVADAILRASVAEDKAVEPASTVRRTDYPGGEERRGDKPHRPPMQRVEPEKQPEQEAPPADRGDQPPPKPFDRDDRPPKRFDDRGGDRPAWQRFDRGDRPPRKFDDRGDRPPRPFDRGGPPPQRFDRGGPPPQRFDRGGPPQRFDRGGPPPQRFDRGDGPPRRFDRDDRGGDRPPRRFDDRGDRPPQRFDRGGPPKRFDRGDGPPRPYDRGGDRPPQRFDRGGPPPRFDRDDRGGGGGGDRPPRRFDRGDRAPRPFDRGDDRGGDRPPRPFDRGGPPPRFDRGGPPRGGGRGGFKKPPGPGRGGPRY